MITSDDIAPHVLENMLLQEQIKNLKNAIASMNVAVKESAIAVLKTLRDAGLVNHRETLKWSTL